jgi:hypothetical protein
VKEIYKIVLEVCCTRVFLVILFFHLCVGGCQDFILFF